MPKRWAWRLDLTGNFLFVFFDFSSTAGSGQWA
jgi:hypothetical protein